MTIRLSDINSPEDIRGFNSEELRELAGLLRKEIIHTVSQRGGHLASSLGCVELTLALHVVFDTPKDKIVWDVGHQSYPHKLITGRYKQFSTLRQYRGLSGYPKRQESEYDNYDTGHAAGSISYALGLALARDRKGENYHIVTVIGDGALTSGLAYEGLNNAGGLNTPFIVVINDNSMAISENVGGIAYYLTALRLAPFYRTAKVRLEKMLDVMPSVGHKAVELIKRLKKGVKYLLFPESWFEALGFRYYGPIDGHDIDALKKIFNEVKPLQEPVLIHVITQKGKGYPPAQKQPELFHGPGPFHVETGQIIKKQNELPGWNKVFGKAMCKFAQSRPNVVAITAAMTYGTGLQEFACKYPDRLFDVGIAEPHAVTFAAGLAQGGLLPVVAVYSSFLQRAFDQIIEDVCLQNLKVVFAIDRAGIVGEDGETHQGEFDLSYLRLIPGITIMAPGDERELVNMLHTAMELSGPSAIRYPKGPVVGVPYEDALDKPEILPVGRAKVLRQGRDITLVAVGNMVAPALETAELFEKERISCGVINARFIKPFDEKTLREVCLETPVLVVEESIGNGGFSESVINLANSIQGSKPVYRKCLPDKFIEHGSQEELREIYGLNAKGIAATVRQILDKGKGGMYGV